MNSKSFKPTVQIITACDYGGGSLQHALTLAEALVPLNIKVFFVNVFPLTNNLVSQYLSSLQVEFLQAKPDCIPAADINIVVDLYREECCMAASFLVRQNKRLILAPTGYLDYHPLKGFSGKAEAIWYVSWDHAVDSKQQWELANQVDVVRCAINTNHFKPSYNKCQEFSQILCRHSRDVQEKFSNETFRIFNQLGNQNDIKYRILGGIETLHNIQDTRITVYAENALDPATFLAEGDIWFFCHADNWRESACIAMLEAMSCGLPVLVTNKGGMREYLQHGYTGFLCSSPEEFIKFGLLLLKNPSIYKMMSHNARRYIEKYHSVKRLTGQLAKLLKL